MPDRPALTHFLDQLIQYGHVPRPYSGLAWYSMSRIRFVEQLIIDSYDF